MKPQIRITLADAVRDNDVIRLLEAYSIAVVVPHDTVLYYRAETSIEEYAGAATAGEIRVRRLVDTAEINQRLQGNGIDISQQLTEKGMIVVVATKPAAS